MKRWFKVNELKKVDLKRNFGEDGVLAGWMFVISYVAIFVMVAISELKLYEVTFCVAIFIAGVEIGTITATTVATKENKRKLSINYKIRLILSIMLETILLVIAWTSVSMLEWLSIAILANCGYVMPVLLAKVKKV